MAFAFGLLHELPTWAFAFGLLHELPTCRRRTVRMALTGAGVGLATATIVLLIATRNLVLVVTLGSVFSIASVLACVIGTVVSQWAGSSARTSRSATIMLLTGFRASPSTTSST